MREGLYDVENPVFTEPAQRCDGCGAICYMPCLACGLRKRKAAIRKRNHRQS